MRTATWHADYTGPALAIGRATLIRESGFTIAVPSERMGNLITARAEYRGRAVPGWICLAGTFYPWRFRDVDSA